MPSSCSVRSRSGRRARTSSTGLATATAGQRRERRVEILGQARRGTLHRKVCDAEQAARRALHFVGGDPIDEMDGEPERDTERDRQDREQRPPRRTVGAVPGRSLP